MTESATHRYHPVSITLHWLMLVLLAAVYATIEFRELFPKGSDPREALKAWHFGLGLTVFGLVWLRLMMRALKPAPAILPTLKGWEMALAKLMHLALYSLMIGMPLLGWLLLSAAGKPIPLFGLQLPALIAENKDLAKSLKEVHEALGVAGYFLVGLHAAAALVHHYVKRDNTLARMLPWRSGSALQRGNGVEDARSQAAQA